MTKRESGLLFAYNAWANNRIFEALAQLSEEQYTRDLRSSYGTIHATLAHLVGVEKMWLSRWQGKPDTSLLSAGEVTSLTDLKSLWEKVAAETARFVSRQTERTLDADIDYTNARGERFSHPLMQSLQHVVNHSTYHRGQLAGMARQVGGQPVNTDLITFYRHLKPPSKPVVH